MANTISISFEANDPISEVPFNTFIKLLGKDFDSMNEAEQHYFILRELTSLLYELDDSYREILSPNPYNEFPF